MGIRSEKREKRQILKQKQDNEKSEFVSTYTSFYFCKDCSFCSKRLVENDVFFFPCEKKCRENFYVKDIDLVEELTQEIIGANKNSQISILEVLRNSVYNSKKEFFIKVKYKCDSIVAMIFRDENIEKF